MTWYNRFMTSEFGQRIIYNVLHPGEIRINGVKIENPVRRVRILPQVLNDLESLAIEAFPEEIGDSHGQLFLNESVAKQKRKYPNEQPQEVWRRDIAKLARHGVSADDIARALIEVNGRLKVSLHLDSINSDVGIMATEKVKNKVLSYWPSAVNRI